ncbi:MAG: Uma2 family endonuclease [Planctomycetia bacterium]|nr:Uma2 family endonuclease [Planctomycetia bacterium]
MNMLTQPKLTFTPEDLLTMPNGDDYELVDGHLLERRMGMRSGRIAGRIGLLIGNFCEANKAGTYLPADVSYQCFPSAPTKVRRPDVSFLAAGRIPAGQEPEGHCLLAPDLVTEVVSPNDEFEEVVEKVEEWLAAGVRLVWLVSPRTRTIWVYRRGGSGLLLREKDDLTGEDVLPGFRCTVREIFLPPPGVANPS